MTSPILRNPGVILREMNSCCIAASFSSSDGMGPAANEQKRISGEYFSRLI